MMNTAATIIAGAITKTIELAGHVVLVVAGLFSFIPAPLASAPPPAPVTPAVQAQELPEPVRVLVVGDMLFDRSLRRASQAGGYLFDCTKSLFARADFAVGNLEGPITEAASVSRGSAEGSPENYIFTFPTTTAALLFAHRFGTVSIGNNHIGDFGAAGIASTRASLATAGVGYFGGIGGSEPVARTDYEDVPLSFVSYNEFGGMPPEQVAEKIMEEKSQGRVVVVYAHWGDEYATSTMRLRPIAQLFAQAGASAVVGSHPHVVMPHEKIGQTPVYYSLGNFIFDQYWDEGVSHGLALLLDLYPDGTVAADEYPVVLTPDGRTCPAAAVQTGGI